MKKIIISVILLFFWIVLLSQAPEKLSYQAILRDTESKLIVNQNVGIQVSIITGSPEGSSIYTETYDASTNENGMVTIEIGNGTPVSGTFSAIDWSGGTYFIKNEVDPEGGDNYTITTVGQILSVPYALHATTVENESQSLSLTGSELSISGSNSVDLTDISLSGFIENFGITETINTGSVVPERIFLVITAQLEYYDGEWEEYGATCTVRWIDNDHDGQGTVMIIPSMEDEVTCFISETDLIGRIITYDNNAEYIDFHVDISANSVTITRTNPSFSANGRLDEINIFYTIF